MTCLSGIWTAAVSMLGGGDIMKESCRTDQIMSDAAYVMLSKDSKQYTGNFAIDDEVLINEGITDMDQYACVKGKIYGVTGWMDGLHFRGHL